MKAIIILLLFSLSLCDDKNNTAIPTLRMPPIGPPTSPPPYIKCSSNSKIKGLCTKKRLRDIKNKNQFKSKYSNNCEKCEKKGNCPLTCRKFVKNVQKMAFPL